MEITGISKAACRLLAMSAALLLGLALLTYALLLLINWSDRPPSAAVLEFREIHESRPAVADAENAFVHILGMEVEPGHEPLDAGRVMADRLRHYSATRQVRHPDHPLVDLRHYHRDRDPAVRELVETCRKLLSDSESEARCLRAFADRDEALEQWRMSDQWLLERYRKLLVLRHWRTVFPDVPLEEAPLLPPREAVLDGQLLFLAGALNAAHRGDVERMREMFERDARFWRRMLLSADGLIPKLIATEAVERNLGWLNAALRSLPEARVAEAVPEIWHEPFSRDERSMVKAFAGERAWYRRELEQTFEDTYVRSILRPFFQPQDFDNPFADRMLAVARLSEAPYADVGEAAAMDERFSVRGDPHPFGVLYNPVAKYWFGVYEPDYANGLRYAVRTASLEARRRAVLVAADMRAQGMSASRAPGFLAEAELRDPFTDAPFAWDAEAARIVFTVPGGDSVSFAYGTAE